MDNIKEIGGYIAILLVVWGWIIISISMAVFVVAGLWDLVVYLTNAEWKTSEFAYSMFTAWSGFFGWILIKIGFKILNWSEVSHITKTPFQANIVDEND